MRYFDAYFSHLVNWYHLVQFRFRTTNNKQVTFTKKWEPTRSCRWWIFTFIEIIAYINVTKQTSIMNFFMNHIRRVYILTISIILILYLIKLMYIKIHYQKNVSIIYVLSTIPHRKYYFMQSIHGTSLVEMHYLACDTPFLLINQILSFVNNCIFLINCTKGISFTINLLIVQILK